MYSPGSFSNMNRAVHSQKWGTFAIQSRTQIHSDSNAFLKEIKEMYLSVELEAMALPLESQSWEYRPHPRAGGQAKLLLTGAVRITRMGKLLGAQQPLKKSQQSPFRLRMLRGGGGLLRSFHLLLYNTDANKSLADASTIGELHLSHSGRTLQWSFPLQVRADCFLFNSEGRH